MCQKVTMSQAIPTRLRNYQKVIETPLPMDVLCGSKNANHPGNHLFRLKVASCLHAYERARTKQQKMNLNRHIIQYMRHRVGARFLKEQRDGTWILAEGQTVRDKVRHIVSLVFTCTLTISFIVTHVQLPVHTRYHMPSDTPLFKKKRKNITAMMTAIISSRLVSNASNHVSYQFWENSCRRKPVAMVAMVAIQALRTLSKRIAMMIQ